HDARMITWQVGHFWMIITQPGGSLSHADLHLIERSKHRGLIGVRVQEQSARPAVSILEATKKDWMIMHEYK
ncbi:hypothetical protein ABIE58_002263, partial [Roseovarius sp. MBR-78]|uniref:hypothetical protein n=1 Tax=Roseovarius sp. MBR-78 TaxID=3156460 RepID=UPI003393F07C